MSNKLSVACISDTHGFLPDVPDSDIVVIAGDIVPLRIQGSIIACVKWFDTEFRAWLEKLDRPVFATFGNHEVGFDRKGGLELMPELPWNLLIDQSTVYKGYKIYGTPWQPTFGRGWAFNASEPVLKYIFESIDDDTDILISHSPAYGYGDVPLYSDKHVGSHSLLDRVLEVQPKAMVVGHIHGGAGIYNIGGTKYVNASYLDEQYRPYHNIPIIYI